MKKNKNLFIITSALSTNVIGINSLETRIYQTLSTINSIKAHVKNAEIWILDASHSELHQSVYDMFPDDVNFFKLNILFKDNILEIKQNAQFLAEEFSKTHVAAGNASVYDVVFNSYLKNMTEIFMLNRFLEYKDISQYHRLYKISGRYLITKNFNQLEHNNSIDSFVFRQKIGANKIAAHLHYQYNCTSWSADISIAPVFKSILLEIENWLKDQFLNQRQVVDVEHVFYKFINDNHIKVNEVANIGVIGLVNNEQKSFYIG